MKRSIIMLIALCILTSCGVLPKDYLIITDPAEQLELVSKHFPEIYNLYKSGYVVITEVYTYTDKKKGEPSVHISYQYHNHDHH